MSVNLFRLRSLPRPKSGSRLTFRARTDFSRKLSSSVFSKSSSPLFNSYHASTNNYFHQKNLLFSPKRLFSIEKEEDYEEGYEDDYEEGYEEGYEEEIDPTTINSPFQDFTKMFDFVDTLTQFLNTGTIPKGKESQFDLSKKPSMMELGKILHDFYLRILAHEKGVTFEEMAEKKPFSGDTVKVVEKLRAKFGTVDYDFPPLDDQQAAVVSSFIQERLVDEDGELLKLNPEQAYMSLEKEVNGWNPSPERAEEKSILMGALRLMKIHVENYMFFSETSQAVANHLRKVNLKIQADQIKSFEVKPEYQNFAELLDDFFSKELSIMEFGYGWKTPLIQYGMNEPSPGEKPPLPKRLFHFSQTFAFPTDCVLVNMMAPEGLSRVALIYWRQQEIVIKQVKNKWVWTQNVPSWWEALEQTSESIIPLSPEWLKAMKKVLWPAMPSLKETDPRFWTAPSSPLAKRIGKMIPLVPDFQFMFNKNEILDPYHKQTIHPNDKQTIRKLFSWGNRGLLLPRS